MDEAKELKKETKKGTRKKSTTKKETEKKEVKKTVEEKVVAKKTKKELNLELRRLQDEIIVEISNISAMQCSYGNNSGEVYFDFAPNDFEEVTLGELREVVRMAKGYFTEYSIIITDVLNKEYNVDDVLEYLALKSIYRDIEDENEDFIRRILESTNYEFKTFIDSKKGNKNFIRNIACKSVYMTRDESDDFELSRDKEEILCDALSRPRKSLINII